MNRAAARVTIAALCTLGVPSLAASSASADTPTCYGHDATIVGSPDSDTLHGTPGNDVIVGLGGGDHIDAGGGRDYICGGPGPDAIWGGGGADHISGGHQHDVIYGGTSNDVIDGGSSSDDLHDGPGRDFVHAGTGHDNFVPGPGDDVMDGGPPANRGRGDWADQLDYSGEASSVDVDLGAGTASGAGIGRDTVRDIEWVLGTSHDDTLAGDASDNVLYGFGGSDVLSGRDGNDDLRGGPGDDVVHGGDGADLLVSQPTDAAGSPDPDTGDDLLDGGPGDDGISVNDASGIAGIDGGPGTDSIRLAGGVIGDHPVSIDLETDTAQLAGQTVPLTGVENVRVLSPDKVTIYGDEGPNELNVGAFTTPQSSDAFVAGRGGDDLLYADAGSVDGGDGYDKCYATSTVSNCEADYYGRPAG